MNFIKALKLFCILIIFVFVFIFSNNIYAQWENPVGEAPMGEILFPLNQGATPQYKTGAMIFGSYDIDSIPSETILKVVGPSIFDKLEIDTSLIMASDTEITLLPGSRIIGTLTGSTEFVNLQSDFHVIFYIQSISGKAIYADSYGGNSVFGQTVDGTGIWGLVEGLSPTALAGKFEGPVYMTGELSIGRYTTITSSGNIKSETLKSATAGTGKCLYVDSSGAIKAKEGDCSSGNNDLSGGVLNNIPKWTSGIAVGGSSISEYNGNIGIGTTTPNRSLHVYKVSAINAEIDLQSISGSSKHWGIYHSSSTEDLRFWNNSGSPIKDVFVISKIGNVGIGTYPDNTRLSINGSIKSSSLISASTSTSGDKCLYADEDGLIKAKSYDCSTNFASIGGGNSSTIPIWTSQTTLGDSRISKDQYGNVFVNIEPCPYNYTLTYSTTTGGYLNGTAIQTVHCGNSGSTVRALANTGYQFSKWSDGVLTAARTDTNISGNLNVTAKFILNRYVLNYISGDGGYIDGNTNQMVAYGGSGTQVKATPNTGYTFQKWSDNNSTNPIRIDTNVSANISTNALFISNTYTVTFDKNGGTGDPNPLSVSGAYESLIALATQGTLTKTGYTFAGWNTQADGAGTKYNAGSLYTITGNVTLYAKWTANTYTVTFDKQSGSGGSNSVIATYGSSMPSATAPTRTGYTFGGYYTAINGGGTQYYSNTMTSLRNWDLTSNTTLYAKWIANTYIVAFNSNGGSGSMTNQSFTYGISQNLTANAFTRTGYTFANWNTQADGSGTSYANSQSVNNLTSTNGATVNLYVKWTANTYIITFDANGGSVSPNNKTVTYGLAIGTLPIPTRSGYNFVNWSTANNGFGSPVTSETIYDTLGNSTIYAIWVPK